MAEEKSQEADEAGRDKEWLKILAQNCEGADWNKKWANQEQG